MDNVISSIKNQICRELVNCSNIVSAINASSEHEDLMYYHIFPTLRRPETEIEKRTFICMRVDVNNASSRNTAVTNAITVQLYVVTHDDLQYVSTGVAAGCTRTDYIAEEIERLFNRDQLGLAQASLLSDTEEQVDARHPMRVITFTTTGLNGVGCS